MSKPWYNLLVSPPAKKRVIGIGGFQGPGMSNIVVTGKERFLGKDEWIGLKFGNASVTDICFWSPDGLRTLAEFANTLADQIDAGYHPRDLQQ